MLSRPQPTGRERFFDDSEIIVSKTNPKGIITYANPVFLWVSGYREQEILGQPHNCIRHPDMPRCVFKLLWDRISTGHEIFAYVVNLAKNGDHYWVHAHVTPTLNASGQIIGYHSNRRVPTRPAVGAIEKVYGCTPISGEWKRVIPSGAKEWRQRVKRWLGNWQKLEWNTMSSFSPWRSKMADRPAEATSEIGQYRDWVRQAAEICEQAARGNLEPRLLNLPAGGDLSRLTNGINGLLDIADAFVREAGACLDATAHHRFYRHIIVRGLLGSF